MYIDEVNLDLKKYSKKLLLFLLILVFFGALTVRLYKLNNPIADWHSWRQADTSAVSRNFLKSGFDILHPRYDDISNVQTGKDNPRGYRFVEFPLYNIFHSIAYKTFNIFTLEAWGRLVTITASLLSMIFLYLLVKKYADATAAISTAFFFAFLPYNIYYSRVLLPDPSVVTATLGAIYFFDKWLDKLKTPHKTNFLWYIIALIFTAAALLYKPYAIFFMLPMLYLVFYKLGFKAFKKWQLYFFFILAITPLILWRWWIGHYPEGVASYTWLFNGNNIRFKGSFFYWIFADRIGRLILGYWGLTIFGAGLLATARKHLLSKNLFFLSFLASSLLYLTIIATGNVQHDYYQILIVPSIAIFMGLGSSFLLNLPGEYFYKPAGILIFLVATFFSLQFGWYFIRDYYNINNPSIIVAGKAVDQITPKDALIIANYNGDTSFLYQTKRQGWPSYAYPMPKLIELGADYLALVNPTQDDYNFAKTYKVIASTPQYIIFDLHKKP